MSNNNNELNILDIVSIVNLYLSILNHEENFKQTSNNELLKELYKQDDLINNKIIEKLNILEEQNKTILQLLKGDNNGKL